MPVELLTVEEAAERLKMNPQTVRRWIRRGLLPAAKVGRKEWRIREADLLPRRSEPTRNEPQKRTSAVEKILALRESLRGRGVSARELIRESRRQLERRHATGRR